MTMGHNKADRGKGVALRLGREDPGGAGGSRARPDQWHPVYKTGGGGAHVMGVSDLPRSLTGNPRGQLCIGNS